MRDGDASESAFEAFTSLPEGLATATIRSVLLYATGPFKAGGTVSKTACTIAERVLKVMILTKWYRAIMATVAASGRLSPLARRQKRRAN
jgi:hypothetical protein